MATVTRLSGKSDDDDTLSTNLESLTLDLKMDILTRLPAKSIMKFRGVSKTWSSLVRSRELIDSFSAVSSKQPRLLVALSNGFHRNRKDELTFFLSFSSDEDESSSSSLVPSFEMAIPEALSRLFMDFGSLHGFLAFHSSTGLMVCNPSTEQVFKLSSPATFVGYDPVDDQHKVLGIIWHPDLRGRDPYPPVHKVLTLGGGGWRNIEGPSFPYIVTTPSLCINGFLYYGTISPTLWPLNPSIVCFDVRYERLSSIKGPGRGMFWLYKSILIEYKGKLAYILKNASTLFSKFNLWTLEDAEKHEWSYKLCVVPICPLRSVFGEDISFPGSNKAGEIIMIRSILSENVEPFYVFYYNVETQSVRKVWLQGVGDNEEFRRSYGFHDKGTCCVRMAIQHVDSITFLDKSNLV